MTKERIMDVSNEIYERMLLRNVKYVSIEDIVLLIEDYMEGDYYRSHCSRLYLSNVRGYCACLEMLTQYKELNDYTLKLKNQREAEKLKEVQYVCEN